MKIPQALICLLLTCCLSLSVNAQQGDETTFYHTTYRSVTLENETAFLAYIKEVIKPLFVEEVDNGRLTGWFVYRPRYASANGSYNYIFSRATNELSNLDEAFEGGFEAAVRRVHDKSPDELNIQQGLSNVVKTELWELSSISVLQPSREPGRFANVGFFRNNTARDIARDLLLQNVVAQWQLARMNRGISAGWGYFNRRFPFDNPDSYDTAEILYYDNFDQTLGAGIGQQIWEGIREDESNLSDNMDRLSETRSFVKRELWELIDYVQ